MVIWLYLVHIVDYQFNFTGINRTEYELTLHARKLQQQGQSIAFCRFDKVHGFTKIPTDFIDQILMRADRDGIDAPPLSYGNLLQKRIFKTKISIQKRVRKINKLLHKVHCPFAYNDTIITVGQDVDSGDMLELAYLKDKLSLNIHIMNHDIIPILFPQFSLIDSDKFSHYIDQTIKVADFFWCNSEHTKQTLQKYISSKNHPVVPMRVVKLGCDLAQYQHKSNGVMGIQINRLLQERFVLYVSTIEIRKNHQVLYDAYTQMLAAGEDDLPKLIFVGRRGWMVDKLLSTLEKDQRVKGNILIFDGITDAELMALYRHCLFTVFPSYIEGYGLPVVEALSFGKYCLAANTGSMPEIGGDFIEYLDPNDVQAWADRILFWAKNPEILREKERYIRDCYIPNSWDTMANGILSHLIKNNYQLTKIQ